MSTKTTFKRISLVAVAALGFGMISVVPSQAASGTTVAPIMALNSPSTATGLTDSPVPAGTETKLDLSVTLGTAAMIYGVNETFSVTYQVLNPNGTDITSLTTLAETTTAAAVLSTLTRSGYTLTIADTATVATHAVGQLTIPASALATGGIYQIKTTTVKGSAMGAVTEMNGAASLARGALYVSGIAVTQGTSKGVVDGKAVTGNSAKVTISLPKGTSGSVYKVTGSGVGSVLGATVDNSATIATVAGATTDFSAGFNITTASANATTAVVNLSSTTAGVQTISVASVDAATGVATALYKSTVTWGAAPTYTSSTAFINTDVNAESVANVTTKSSSGTYASAAVARIDTRQYTSADTTTAVVAGSGNVKTVVVTVTGAGAVDSASGGAARSGSATVATSTTADGVDTFYVFADGRTGDAAIVVSVDGVSVASWTWTFLGTAKTLKEDADNSPTKIYLGIGETGTVSVLAYDSNSKKATLPASLIVTSDTSTIATAVAATNGSATVTGVAAGKTKINFSDGALATSLNKVAIEVIVTKTTAKAGSVKLALDKASYAPGEKMTLTVTALDVDGNPVADGSRNLFSSTGVTANVSFTGLPTTAVVLAGGKAEYVLYAPFSSGDVVVTGTEGTDVDLLGRAAATAAGTTYVAAKPSVTVSVVNPSQDASTDAANEATDAANAATDAALAAADAADAATDAAEDASAAVAKLAKSVNTALKALKKQITALTALVNKLLK
jgi:hypothetical protein